MSTEDKSIRIIALIPCFNEAGRIGAVIRGAIKHVDLVVVADDGSTDGSGNVAILNGAALVDNEFNMGAGAATATGVRFAKLVFPTVETIITLDADGQHNPEDIPLLLATLNLGNDVVFGVRPLKFGVTPFLRWLGNAIFYHLRNFGSRHPIIDGECGFRAFRADALTKIDFQTKHFGYCEEIAIKARALGLRIANAPVESSYGEDLYKYSAWKQLKRGFEIPWTIIKWRLLTWSY